MKNIFIDKDYVDSVPIPANGAAFHWDSKIKGFGLKVTARGLKVFILQYRAAQPDGSEIAIRRTPTRRFKIGRYPKVTVAEARSRAKSEVDRIRPKNPSKTAADPQAEKVESKRNTFKAARLAFIAAKRKEGLRSVAEISRTIERLAAPRWDDRLLADLTRRDAKKLLDDVAAPIVANRLAAHLKTLFYWAVDDERIAISPMARFKRPNDETPRERVPDMAEVAEIWRATDTLTHPYGPAYKVLILTGQRLRQVAKMQWSEIDREDSVWKISGGRMKKKWLHLVILSEPVLAILDGLPRRGPYVFQSGGKLPADNWDRDAKKPLDEEILARRRKITADADAMPEWRNHDLRRSFTTSLRRLGFDRDLVKHIISHAAYTDVTGVYDLFWKERRERERAMEAWAAAVMEAVK